MEFPPTSWSIRDQGLFETAVVRTTNGLSMEVLAKVSDPKPYIYPNMLSIYYLKCVLIQIRTNARIMDDFRVVLSGTEAIYVSKVEIFYYVK
jgi:hypothetical protein